MSTDPPRPPVKTEVAGRIATIWIDRPPLNILDFETLDALAAAFREVAARDDLQLVLLRGAGERAFSAGVAVEIHTRDNLRAMLERFHGALRELDAVPAITAAVVHGHCLGGGMELAAVCDLVVASEDSRFGQPEIRVGCFPPVAAALLPVRLGHGRTLDLLATGRTADAREAERLGFVTRRATGSLDEEVAHLRDELGAQSAAVLRLTKKAVRTARGVDLATALEMTERVYLDELAATVDVEEGTRAFLEKRSPIWQHR